jgi:hypothetical protein
MFCPQCGAQIDEGAKFCIQCGTKTGAVQQTAPQPPAETQGAVTVAAPEAVLVKGLGDAWLFQPNKTLSADKMSGNFEVTPTCVRFIPNALLSAFKFSKKDTVVVPVADIVSVEKTGSLPPTIEILVNSGHVLKIQGYGAAKKAFNMLNQLRGTH